MEVFVAIVKSNSTWNMRHILQQRYFVAILQPIWNQMSNRFQMVPVYKWIRKYEQHVPCITLMHQNVARSRAIFTLRQACHRKLATRDRLIKFGMLGNTECTFCHHEETHDHLFFECEESKLIWKEVLNWI